MILPKRKNVIRPKSKKRQAQDRISNKEAREWKRDKKCTCCGGFPDDIHHSKGKDGYADEYARLNGIPLLLDKRFWVPACRSCHRRIEDNPEWAKENGYSLSRLEKKEYPPDFKMF